METLILCGHARYRRDWLRNYLSFNTAFIAQLYEGNERAKMMGWASAAGSIIAMAMSMASGILATKSWHFPFCLDLLWIIVLIAQMRVLPKVPPEKLDTALLPGGKRPPLNQAVYISIFAILSIG